MFKKVFITLGVIIIVLGAIGGFYWFQLLPAKIRSECATESKDKVNKRLDESRFDTWKDVDIAYDLFYKICVEEKAHRLN